MGQKNVVNKNYQIDQMDFNKKSVRFFKYVILGFVLSLIIFFIFWGIMPRVIENSDANIHFLTFTPVKIVMGIFAILCSRAIEYYVRFTKNIKIEEIFNKKSKGGD